MIRAAVLAVGHLGLGAMAALALFGWPRAALGAAAFTLPLLGELAAFLIRETRR